MVLQGVVVKCGCEKLQKLMKGKGGEEAEVQAVCA